MLLDFLTQVGPRKRDVVIMIGHNHAGDFFADAVGQTDYAQFLDIRRVLVNLFNFVGIDVLAVGIDDDVL